MRITRWWISKLLAAYYALIYQVVKTGWLWYGSPKQTDIALVGDSPPDDDSSGQDPQPAEDTDAWDTVLFVDGLLRTGQLGTSTQVPQPSLEGNGLDDWFEVGGVSDGLCVEPEGLDSGHQAYFHLGVEDWPPGVDGLMSSIGRVEVDPDGSPDGRFAIMYQRPPDQER